MPRTQLEKVRAFRALHARPGAFVIPNPWDAGSARLLASLGFEALATTSAGHAFALGKKDGEVTRDEAMAHARLMVDAVDVPVAADLEKCFADDPEEAAKAIPLAAATGLVGGSIEDSTGDPARPIFDFNLAVERVAAAVEAARRLPVPYVLTARAENFLNGRPDLDDTIKRLQAFEKAGAEVLFAPGLRTLEQIRTVCGSVSRPVNVVMGLVGIDLTVQQLAEAGVKRISLGSSLARLALASALRAGREISDQGSFGFAKDALPSAEANALMRGKSA